MNRLDVDNVIDIGLEIAQKSFSLVKGRKNYTPKLSLEPNSSAIVEVRSKKFVLIITDKENKPTIYPIYYSIYDELSDLKDALEDGFITKQDYVELKEFFINKIKDSKNNH